MKPEHRVSDKKSEEKPLAADRGRIQQMDLCADESRKKTILCEKNLSLRIEDDFQDGSLRFRSLFIFMASALY